MHLSRNRKILLENFLSLSTLQLFNYLLPLITLPYLVRVLGADRYGIIIYAQSIILLFNIITDFGFNLTGVKEVSENKDSKPKLEFIFTNIYIIKFILLGLCGIILFVLIFLIPRFKEEYIVFIFSFGTTIGYTFFPSWFFQGMENMKYITIFNVTTKIIFTVLIFIFIKHHNHYYLVPLTNSLGYLTTGIIGFFTVKKKYNMRFKTKRIFFTKHIKESIYVFLSIGSSSFLYLSPNIFLGSFLGYNYSAYFSGAEKILSAFKNIVTIINQVIFPRFAAIKSSDKNSYLQLWKKLFKYLIIISSFISIILFFSAQKLIDLILTNEFTLSISTLKILAVSIILQAIILFYGQQGLLIIGKKKELAFSQLIPTILFLVTAPIILSLTSNYYYFLYLFIICQTLIIFIRYFFLKMSKFFNKK